MPSPNPPAQQAGLPLNQGVVNDPANAAAEFTFAQPWFYLFQQLWRKLGGQFSKPQTMVFALQTAAGPPAVVTFYSVVTGEVVGHVVLTP